MIISVLIRMYAQNFTLISIAKSQKKSYLLWLTAVISLDSSCKVRSSSKWSNLLMIIWSRLQLKMRKVIRTNFNPIKNLWLNISNRSLLESSQIWILHWLRLIASNFSIMLMKSLSSRVVLEIWELKWIDSRHKVMNSTRLKRSERKIKLLKERQRRRLWSLECMVRLSLYRVSANKL